jgi:hypothetical protein
VLVFRAKVTDDLNEFIALALGTFGSNEDGASGIELGTALETQVTVGVGIGRVGGNIFTTGRADYSQKNTEAQ